MAIGEASEVWYSDHQAEVPCCDRLSGETDSSYSWKAISHQTEDRSHRCQFITSSFEGTLAVASALLYHFFGVSTCGVVQ